MAVLPATQLMNSNCSSQTWALAGIQLWAINMYGSFVLNWSVTCMGYCNASCTNTTYGRETREILSFSSPSPQEGVPREVQCLSLRAGSYLEQKNNVTLNTLGDFENKVSIASASHWCHNRVPSYFQNKSLSRVNIISS